MSILSCFIQELVFLFKLQLTAMKLLFNNILLTFNMCRICIDVSFGILNIAFVFLLLSLAGVQPNY